MPVSKYHIDRMSDPGVAARQASYATLQRQCAPLTPAATSNVQFLPPTVCAPLVFDAPAMPPCPPLLVDTINASVNTPMLEKPEQRPPSRPGAPDQWGPHLWIFMHTAAANYPVQPTKCQQAGMRNWLRSLKWTIPCTSCAEHFSNYISNEDLEEACKSRHQLFAMLVKIHNAVNKRTGKPEMSLEDAMARYGLS